MHGRRGLNFGMQTKLFLGIFFWGGGAGGVQNSTFQSSETFEFRPALKKQHYASQSEKSSIIIRSITCYSNF